MLRYHAVRILPHASFTIRPSYPRRLLSMTDERSISDEGGVQHENRPLDLNRASVNELTGLNGVGEILARRIIAARPFRSVDDLSHVQGISSALIKKFHTSFCLAGWFPHRRKSSQQRQKGPQPYQQARPPREHQLPRFSLPGKQLRPLPHPELPILH